MTVYSHRNASNILILVQVDYKTDCSKMVIPHTGGVSKPTSFFFSLFFAHISGQAFKSRI